MSFPSAYLSFHRPHTALPNNFFIPPHNTSEEMQTDEEGKEEVERSVSFSAHMERPQHKLDQAKRYKCEADNCLKMLSSSPQAWESYKTTMALAITCFEEAAKADSDEARRILVNIYTEKEKTPVNLGGGKTIVAQEHFLDDQRAEQLMLQLTSRDGVGGRASDGPSAYRLGQLYK